MDRRREDVRDSFLDMVDAENETAIQTFETPLEVSEHLSHLFPVRAKRKTGQFVNERVSEPNRVVVEEKKGARPLRNLCPPPTFPNN